MAFIHSQFDNGLHSERNRDPLEALMDRFTNFLREKNAQYELIRSFLYPLIHWKFAKTLFVLKHVMV